MGVGMPQNLLLQDFGERLRDAFGEIPYWVGSSLREKHGWRDVDVRLMLPDEEWARMELGDPATPANNARWRAIVIAWSSYGQTLTGLPIDFQLQQRSHANATYARAEHPRSALFNVSTCVKPDPPKEPSQ